MTELELPQATHFGDLNLAESYTLPARVIEGGIRVLSEAGLVGTFHRRPKALLQKAYDDSIIPEADWEVICGRIPYSESGERRYGYSTRILGIMVKAMLSSRNRGPLTKAQQRHISTILVIRDALVDVAIDSLIDECTGYQLVRPDDALQKLFEKYLQEHARKWAKTFPDDFWNKLAKVRGIADFELQNRPGYFGHLVNDLVYSRLAPRVLEELKRMNPRMPYGERANRHHQYLTLNDGLPELRDHLNGLMFLMDGYQGNWDGFYARLNQSRPQFGKTLELDIYQEFEGVG